jgi:hypothetical protein
MSNNFTTQDLLDKADECPGTLGVEKIQVTRSVFLDQASKQLVLKGFTDVKKIFIFNLMGQKTVELNAIIGGSIDVSNLDKGLYVIQVEDANGIVKEKILLQ